MGQIVRTAGSVNDITRRKTTDPITGLCNRLFFLDRLQAAVEAAQRDARHYAVLILSLDHFRMVNDGLGHPASEELLAQVAGRLRSMVRASGREVVVARTGEDEFGMSADRAAANLRCRERGAQTRWNCCGSRITWKAGGSRWAEYGNRVWVAVRRAEELLRNAETAMYDASTKENGKFVDLQPEHA